jgi:hypothetical protein
VDPISRDDDPDRRHSEGEQAAYLQGLRDGRIDALEHVQAHFTRRLDKHEEKVDGMFDAIEKRQERAEKMLYILAGIVALSQGSAVATIVKAAVP